MRLPPRRSAQSASLGLHFFVPANIIPLLEIVRGAKTSPETIATAFDLAKRLRKKAVLSGNAFGFIGNRMIFDYLREANAIAEEGVPPCAHRRGDEALRFSDGPVRDERLIRPGRRRAHSESGAARRRLGRTNVLAKLVERGRLGQKTHGRIFQV